jgi:hypothetical protein
MGYDDLQKPQSLEYYKKFYGYRDVTGHRVSEIMGLILVSIVSGLFVGVILMMFAGRGKDVSFMPFFLMGTVISAAVWGLLGSGKTTVEAQQIQQHNAEIQRAHDNAWAEYNAAVALREKHERENREAQERWKREAPERERLAALKQAEEEKARQEREKTFALRQRQAAFEKADAWARGALETAYQDVAMQLAAEEGILDQRDVLKVFATVYPRLPIADDNRMGCLRAYIGKDERITAIQKFLPPPNDENTYPT